MEIAVARANSADAMLAHKNRRVRVVEDIPGKMRQFPKDLAGDVSMATCREKNVEPG